MNGSHWRALTTGLALAAIGLATTARAADAEPVASKRIYIAADDHTDYMWSMDEEGYRRAFLEMLDYYLDQADATKDNPPPHQSRWNCDGNLWLWVYERNRSTADFNRLIDRIRSGHISAPLNAAVSCYGGQPLEAILRGMYYAGSLERRFGLRFPLAVAMENQTLPHGLGGIWAGAGASYSWKGVCGCASKMPAKGASAREHEIYWWRAADGSRILMKWNSMLGPDENRGIGGYAEAFYTDKVVDYVDSDPDFQRRYPFRVIGAFGKGWDRPKILTDEFIRVAKAKTTPERQVIVSNEADFFRDFERSYGAQLPALSAAYGNEWDVYSASMPEVSAQVRRAVEKLRTAEAMATLVNLQRPDFMRRHATARAQAHLNLGLYWEHNWTADSPIVSREENAAWHRRLAREISAYVDRLHEEAARALGALIRRSGERTRFFVFNSLGWTRTDVAEVPLASIEPIRMRTHFPKFGDPPAPPVEPFLPFHVVEVATGREVPSQIVTADGRKYLRILARDVPAIGYQVYELRSGEGAKLPDAARAGDGVLENASYKLVLSGRGAITSLIDKERGNRELVREIQGRALNDLGPGGGALAVENAGPVSVTLRADASGPLQHTTRVTLFRDSRRIEIHNEITQNFPDVRTWGFGFNLEKPDLWHEEVGTVIRAKLLAEGGHYSPRNARYEWLTLNHFADLGGADGFGATLSNSDCAFVQLGQSTVDLLDTQTPLLSVLVGGQVDGAKLGIPNQGGDTRFTQRFALQTRDGFDGAKAMRFALEHQNPLTAGVVAGGRSYPETNFSLLTVSNADVLVWTVKPAEDGEEGAVVMRLWNQTHAPVRTSVQFAGTPAAARHVTHVETDVGALQLDGTSLPMEFTAQQLRSILIKLTAPAQR